MLIESISGIRGIVPSSLNSDLVAKYTLAFHRMCDLGSIIIGRDSRPSGSELISSVINQLISAGRDVQDCGICPTPTVQFAVEDTEAVGGIIITASHNPSDWNGLKFVLKDGCFLNSKQFANFLKLMESEDKSKNVQRTLRANPGRYFRFDQAIRRHIDRILSIDFIDTRAIRKRKFKVAVDTVNGAAGNALPTLLEKLNCEVIKINCDLSGEFTRGTEPLPQHLTELMEVVKEHRCDVGFATDPDADRLAIVDNTGHPIGEEYTLVLAIDDFLKSTGKQEIFATNLSTTMAVEKVADKYGCKVERTAVGEINVVERMKQVNARLGGEGNGGVILKDVHLGRDSLVAAILVLDRMARSEKNLSQIVSGLPQFYMVKDKIDKEKVDLDRIYKQTLKTFDDANVIKTDGIKFVWDNRWIHLRPSNTEPIVRIYAEATSINAAKKLISAVKSKL